MMLLEQKMVAVAAARLLALAVVAEVQMLV